MARLWLTFIMLSALAAGCSSDNIPSEFLEDRKHLVQTFRAFDAANKISRVTGGAASETPPPGIEEKVLALIEKGLKEGEAISNEFLDWLHPEMRMFFRGKYLWGHRLILEGRKEDRVSKQVTGNQLVQEWYHYFWDKNVEDIYRKAYPKKVDMNHSNR